MFLIEGILIAAISSLACGAASVKMLSLAQQKQLQAAELLHAPAPQRIPPPETTAHRQVHNPTIFLDANAFSEVCFDITDCVRKMPKQPALARDKAS